MKTLYLVIFIYFLHLKNIFIGMIQVLNDKHILMHQGSLQFVIRVFKLLFTHALNFIIIFN